MLDILEELYVEAGIINTIFRPKSTFYPHGNKCNIIPNFYEMVMEEFRTVCGAKRYKQEDKGGEVDIVGPLCSLKKN